MHIVMLQHSVTTHLLLIYYSFLGKIARSSKSPICTWKKYTLITPSGMTDAVCPACMHAVSVICPWGTVLVYNNQVIEVCSMGGLVPCPCMFKFLSECSASEIEVATRVQPLSNGAMWISRCFLCANKMLMLPQNHLRKVLYDLVFRQVHGFQTCMQNIGHMSVPSQLSQGVASEGGGCRHPDVIIKPDLKVHVRANVPGTTVNMVHVPEYGTFGQGQKQENAPKY